MDDIKNCEEIVYNFQKGGSLAMAWATGRLKAWATGRLKGVEDIIAFKMLGQLKERTFSVILERKGRLETPIVL